MSLGQRSAPTPICTPMYVWHKYWSRKTWNVVGEFIKHYTPEQGIVFDPFAGSGVVAIEAVRNKRRAIVCDLNPTASLITELTVRPVKLLALQQAFDRVREQVRKRIEALYEVHCVKCGEPVVAACFVRENDEVTEVRYPGCPACGHRCETGCKLRKDDREALVSLEKKRIKEWHPRNQFFYDDGTPFMKKERFDSIDALFTQRNLQAVAWIYEAIQSEKSPQMRKFLMGAFTSMVHLCTRMMPVGNPQPSNHYTFFSSPGWTQHSYWHAPRYMEQNVWTRFEGAVTGHQGILKAKIESNEALPAVKITDDWQDVLSGKADLAVITGDSLELMEAMPDDCVDYIFTDPPYDASIQYGELSYLWNAWLEAATTMTSALLRGSNLPVATPKTMVLPEEREKDFDRKMESPLFRDHFTEEQWQLAYFDAVRAAFLRSAERMDIDKFDRREGNGDPRANGSRDGSDDAIALKQQTGTRRATEPPTPPHTVQPNR